MSRSIMYIQFVPSFCGARAPSCATVSLPNTLPACGSTRPASAGPDKHASGHVIRISVDEAPILNAVLRACVFNREMERANRKTTQLRTMAHIQELLSL